MTTFQDSKTSSRQIKLWLIEALRPNSLLLTVAVICSAGVAGASLAVAWLMKPFVAATSPSAGQSTLSAHQLHQIDLISLGLVLAYVVRGVFSYGQTVAFSDAGQRL